MINRLLKESDGIVFFEESSYDQDSDRPVLGIGNGQYILSVFIDENNKVCCATEENGFLFQYTEDDLTPEDREFLVEEAYQYRFGEE